MTDIPLYNTGRHLTVKDLKRLGLLSRNYDAINLLGTLNEEKEEYHNDPPLDHFIPEDDLHDSFSTKGTDPIDDASPTTSTTVVNNHNNIMISNDLLRAAQLKWHHARQEAWRNAQLQASPVSVFQHPMDPNTTNDGNDRRRGDGPVDLDDSVVGDEEDNDGVVDDDDDDDVNDDDDEDDDEDDNVSRPSGAVSVDDNPSQMKRLSIPVDLDNVEDQESHFNLIWKEHEDEFLVWKEVNPQQGDGAGSFHRAIPAASLGVTRKYQYGTSSRKQTGRKSSDFWTLSGKNDNNIVKQMKTGQQPNKLYSNPPSVAPSDEGRASMETDDVASLSSMDTFGFSLAGKASLADESSVSHKKWSSLGGDEAASVDSYGFTVASRPPPAPTKPTLKASKPRVVEQIYQELDSASEDTPAVFEDDSKGSSSAAAAVAAPAGDNVMHHQKDDDDKPWLPSLSSQGSSSQGRSLEAAIAATPTIPTSKARGLRSLRLRSTPHVFAPMDVGQPRSISNSNSKAADAALSYSNGIVGVVQAGDDEGTVMSEITTQTKERYFLQVVHHVGDDDVSSVGFSAQGDALALLDLPGHDMKNRPSLFDSSHKTPPRLYQDVDYNEDDGSDDEVLGPGDDGDEEAASKYWDDVSSIGLTGVEALATAERRREMEEKPRKSHSRLVPFVIRPRLDDEDCDGSGEKRQVSRSTNKKTMKSQDIFRMSDSSKNKGKVSSKKETPVLDINPTFSTVWAEDESDLDADTYDLEEQATDCHPDGVHKEVSSTLASTEDTAAQQKIQPRFLLTARDWLVIAAVLVLVAGALIIVVVYVYAVAEGR